MEARIPNHTILNSRITRKEGVHLYDGLELLTPARVPETIALFERNFSEPHSWIHLDEIEGNLHQQPGVRPDFMGILGTMNNQVIGAILAAREPLYIEKWNIPLLAIDEDYREKGRGKALVATALEGIELMGGKYVTTDTNRDQMDGNVVQFWLDCGFEQDGEPQEGYWDNTKGMYLVRFIKKLWK